LKRLPVETSVPDREPKLNPAIGLFDYRRSGPFAYLRTVQKSTVAELKMPVSACLSGLLARSITPFNQSTTPV